MLDRLVTEPGSTPAFILCDNGPEMTADALRDWCRFSGAWARSRSAGTVETPSRWRLRRI